MTTNAVMASAVGTATNEKEWTVGLFDCFSNCQFCVYATCCFPCAGCSFENDENQAGCFAPFCCYMICPCLYGCTKRKSFREKYGLRESPCCDCCVNWCCPCCELIQRRGQYDAFKVESTAGRAQVQRPGAMQMQ